MNKCPECFSKEISIAEKTREILCKACGLILEDAPIDTKHELSAEMKKYASMPALAKAGGSAINGNIIKNSWLYSTREKNIQKSNIDIEELSARLKLPELVCTEAKIIFKQVVEKNLNIGRDNIGFVYASVYTACNIHNFPKTPLEVTAYSEVSIKKLIRANKQIVRELNLSTSICDPIKLVPRFGAKLKLSAVTISLAIGIISQLKGKSVIAGKFPSTIVASALYIASKINKEYITQRQVANAIGLLEITLRNRSKEMEKELKE